MNQKRKTPTIQDVARSAKVSTATVSRALSSPEKVSEATRARISAAIHATGYTLNQAARSLRQRNARTILVALPDIRNPFFSSILDAIEREATSRGYGVLVANLYLGQETARRLQDYMLSNRADGLLLLDGSLSPETLRAIASPPNSVPLVLACEDIPQTDFHTVLTDNAEAAARATRHLIDLGHRKIGHILGPEHNVVARDRLAGFKQALEGAGQVVQPEWLLRGNFEITSGFAAAARFMALSDRPTAMFAANDESAIGFLSGLRRHGLECPRDISVIGFDDLGVAAHYTPPLTTMRQPRETLGRMAAETLIDILEKTEPAGGPLRILLTSDLIVRESTAIAPRP
ncbi:LacI family DNA-binding transcriptional regulator [Devosia sp. YIM 151766]|uniref:LacI family DNA-binding transcriptional regulator n=1 Tax=Devosia sp. YIM 151766 TaxID=3017325 RepID=UPI00255CE76F|nr:LacI family DNA-binding transcriptional regulator [Devosia sp. YIM 151766]WIY54081.1 LacI family DNA-binding transcriptional regulator [Devosia sp. YIM 151766]